MTVNKQPAAAVDGPLNGVRVLDLTHVWAGPLAVRFLADFGAEVVRVEAPTGRGPQQASYSPLGGWLGGAPGERPWDNNAMFVKLMRNRRGLCIDLKTDAGRQTFLQLVGEADVLVENFSAHTMQNLGLGFETLQAVNPGLIYLTMPGFGHSGPLAERVAFGPTVEAMSGLTDVFGYGDDEPRNTAMALMDPVSGVNAVAAVVVALQTRRQNGSGCKLEMTLHEGGVSYCGPWLLDQQLGVHAARWATRHPQMVPHGTYAAAGDDQWVVITCADDHQWQNLYGILAEEYLAEHLQADWGLATRRSHEAQIDAAIAKLVAGTPKATVAERLQVAGVPAGAVATVPEMVADPQVQARGFFVAYERHATPMPGNPIKMPSMQPQQWRQCPGLGEHNAEVLEDWLGLSPEETQDLYAQGVLHDKPPA